MKKIFIILGILFGWGFASSPLIVAVENEPNRINPIFSEDHDVVIGAIFSGLIRLDENGKILPDLAKRWKVSQDGLNYEFELRNDVKWHDGEKFDIDDVIFTLQALRNKKVNSPLRVNFEMISNIRKLGPQKLKITLSSPFPAFLEVMSVGILPKHLLDGLDLNTASFNFSPIGTGAYRFKSWKRGQYIELEANPSFYLGEVQSKHLILKKISNPSIVAMELKKGSVDAGLVDFELASSFANDARFKMILLSSADYRALMFNLHHPILKDSQVRLALNYAINKQSMLETLIHSHGKIAHHPLQSSWANPSKYANYDYNPQKALKILENLGWKKNKNGLLEKEGRVFEFEIYTMNDDPLRVALASVLQSDFAKLGIGTKVVAKPAGSFDYTRTDSFIVGWGSPLDPDLHTYRVFSSFADTEVNSEGWNFGHYQNPQVDKSLKLARSTLNQKKRKKHYANFISALHQDPPYIFLLYLDFPFVYNAKITGIKPNIVGHHGVGFTWNIWEWKK